MGKKRILLLRSGIHMEFAYKTLFRKNCEVITLDTPSSKQIAFGDQQFFLEDIRNTDEMVEEVKRINKKMPIDGICTFATSAIKPLGILSDYFNLNYYSETVADILSNKYKTRRFISERGEKSIEFEKISCLNDLEIFSEKVGFPLILKPTDNASGRGVIIIDDKSKMKESYEYSFKSSFNKELIAEEYIIGDELCAEILIYNKEIIVLSISKKLVTDDKYCIELMDITPAPISKETERHITNYFENLISKFEIENLLIHVEFKMTKENNPVIIEINPRPAGGKLIESIYYLKDINVFDILFDMAMKNDIDIEEIKRKLRIPSDKFSLFYSFISPQTSGYIKKIKGIEEIKEKLKYKYERINLENQSGDFLKEPKTNGEFRGSMYLFDTNPEVLISRAKEIENLLVYEFEDK